MGWDGAPGVVQQYGTGLLLLVFLMGEEGRGCCNVSVCVSVCVCVCVCVSLVRG